MKHCYRTPYGELCKRNALPIWIQSLRCSARNPPGLDIDQLLEDHAGENYDLHQQHVNPAHARTLKTIGFDRCYVRAGGAVSLGCGGAKYLDLLSGYGVFSLGRNHPDVRRVLIDFLNADYPSLVKMEAPLLSGLLAKELKKRMPNQLDMVFFTNSGTEGVETAMKYARCATGKAGHPPLPKIFSRPHLRLALAQWRRKFSRGLRAFHAAIAG